MRVIAAVTAIPAVFFLFTGNIELKNWRSILLVFQDISFQSFEEVLLENTKVLAHHKKVVKIDVRQLNLVEKKSRKHEQVSLLLYLLSVKSSL